MTWVAVAIGGASLIGAGASYAGAKKQAKASQQAGQMNMDMFNILNRQQQPFIGSGYGAMGRLNTLLGINPRPNAQPPMSTPMTAPQDMGAMGGGSGLARLYGQMRAQQMGQGGGGTAGGSSPFSRMYGEMRARQMAQQGGGGNAYMPTPGGGVQPIMQGGGQMYAGGPGGDPYMNRNARLNQILQLRAANGDTQAAEMMRSLAGLG